MNKEIPLLRPQDIDVRVQSISDKGGYSCLLYKNARVDMRILDEVYGPLNWQRKHGVINNNLYCTVEIWDEAKQSWISKEDVGIPSFAQGEKGEASDSFKRACVNVGIGRELYTAPFIWIKALEGEIKANGNKKSVYTKLHVTKIEYDEDRNICLLEIGDENGNHRYGFYNKQANATAPKQAQPISKQTKKERPEMTELVAFINAKKIPVVEVTNTITEMFKKNNSAELDGPQLKALLIALRERYGSK